MESYKTLHSLLQSLFDDNTLKNWSILQEKSGSILCKLRFIGHDGNSAATREDSMPVKHRLVSQKQDNRNNLRAKSFKDSKAISPLIAIIFYWKTVYEATQNFACTH